MINDENLSNNHHQKRKIRKDFLYKIGKLKQNNFLHDKGHGNQFGTQQSNHKKPKFYEQQEQQDIQLDFPTHQISTQTVSDKKQLEFANNTIQQNNSTKNKQKVIVELQKHQNQQKIIQQKAIKKEREQTIQNCKKAQQHQQQIKYELKNQSQKIEQKQKLSLSSMHKPFVFEEFDQEIQQNDESKSTTQAVRFIEPKQQIKDKKQQNISQEQQSLSDSHESERQIKGVSITSTSLEGNVFIKIVNKKQLVLSRLPPGIILKCILRKSSDIFNPQYDFYLNNGLKHILSAKKNSLSNKQIFKLSLQLGKYRGKDLIGTIMANTVHSIYWLYKQIQLQDDLQFEIKGSIRYQKLISNQARKMRVQLYTDSNKETKIESKNLGHENSIGADLILQSIQLKEKQSSIKNFALVDNQDTEYEYLKMNKVSDNMFQVQIQHPLSPLQAFAISLTRFDAQLK